MSRREERDLLNLHSIYSGIAVAVAGGVILAVIGFAARRVFRRLERRRGDEFWPGTTDRLLMQAVRYEGQILLKEKKEYFSPPYIRSKAWVGQEMFGSDELDYLVHSGLAELRNNFEEMDGRIPMGVKEYHLTKRGRKWARRLIRREERALKRIRP